MEPVLVTLKEQAVPSLVESELRRAGMTVRRTYANLGVIACDADTGMQTAVRAISGVLEVEYDWSN